MTDPTEAIYNVLNWPNKLRPHKLNAIIPDHPKSIAVDCSCGDWAMESVGTDQTVRNYIHAEHRAHIEKASR